MARLETTPTLPAAPSPTAEIQDLSAGAPAHGFTVYDGMLLGMVVTWAANPSAIKWALQYMDPLAFNALRFLIATLVPVMALLLSGEKFSVQRGDGPKLFLLGLGGHGIYQLLFITGINITLAGNVALILAVSPVFVAIFSSLLGYERTGSHTWVGVSLTLLGVGLVVLGTGDRLEFGPKLLGDVLTLCATSLWGLYTVLSQPLLKRYSSVKLNALTMPVGSLVLLVFAAPSLATSAPRLLSAPPAAWLILLASGLFAVSLAYIIWYKGVQKLGATRTAIYSNLVPVLAGAISFFVLGEVLRWQFWAGMVLVILGVSLARFGSTFRLRRAGAE